MFQLVAVILGGTAAALLLSGAVGIGLTLAVLTLFWVAAFQPSARTRRAAPSPEELRRQTITWIPGGRVG
jgi:hypothetical protein